MNRATARAFITAAQTLTDATSPHGADWAWIQHTLMRQTTNLGSLRRSLPMPWPLPPGPPVPDTAVDTTAPLLLDLDTDLTDMAAVGALYEALLEHDLVNGRVVKSADPTRKATGTWYTPPPVAAAMCALQWAQQAHQAMDDHLTEQHNTTLAALTPPPPEPAPPLPKALLDLLNKHPSPHLDGLL